MNSFFIKSPFQNCVRVECFLGIETREILFALVEMTTVLLVNKLCCQRAPLPGEPGQFHLWPGIGQGSQSRDHHACAIEASE